MIKKYKLEILLTISVILGAIWVQSLLNTHNAAVAKNTEDNLVKEHTDGVLRAKAGLDVYAVLVSSLKAYLLNKDEFPTELEYQGFLKELVNDINFNDSIVVSYLDKNHVFKYVFDVKHIDRIGLRGQSVANFRPPAEIQKLDKLMEQEGINIFQPINLQEGWVGLPFNFSAKHPKNDSGGYIAPLINIKYLLDYFYANDGDKNFVHSFVVNDSIDVTREAIYDGTIIYNTARDPEYYKNFAIPEDQYIYSKLNFYGLSLTIGSAYKKLPTASHSISIITYTWYALISIFSMLILYQFSRNRKLTQNLKSANREIAQKNSFLEKNFFKIQTLIKEVHHRTKNNMQMISNLLSMQDEEYNDPKVTSVLEETKNRIQSMSLVHEKLYGSLSLEDVNVKQYVEQLIQFVEDTISNTALKPKKHIQIEDELLLDAETMASLGLIINELITNSYKYAFAPATENQLTLSLSLDGTSYKLYYSDSGPGLPKDFDIETSDSLGMQLLFILASQLNGSVSYSHAPHCAFNILFKKAQAVHKSH